MQDAPSQPTTQHLIHEVKKRNPKFQIQKLKIESFELVLVVDPKNDRRQARMHLPVLLQYRRHKGESAHVVAEMAPYADPQHGSMHSDGPTDSHGPARDEHDVFAIGRVPARRLKLSELRHGGPHTLHIPLCEAQCVRFASAALAIVGALTAAVTLPVVAARATARLLKRLLVFPDRRLSAPRFACQQLYCAFNPTAKRHFCNAPYATHRLQRSLNRMQLHEPKKYEINLMLICNAQSTNRFLYKDKATTE